VFSSIFKLNAEFYRFSEVTAAPTRTRGAEVFFGLGARDFSVSVSGELLFVFVDLVCHFYVAFIFNSKNLITQVKHLIFPSYAS
jgi:hypothetical protein